MVVGQHQAVSAHHFAGAESAAQTGHGIFHAGMVQTIDVLRGELEAHFAHLGLVHLLQLVQQPHALTGPTGGYGEHGYG